MKAHPPCGIRHSSEEAQEGTASLTLREFQLDDQDKEWTLTTEEFVSRFMARRLYRYQDVPIYGRIWRWGDNHQSSVIWTTRVGSIIAVLFIVVCLIYSVLVPGPGHLGVPTC